MRRKLEKTALPSNPASEERFWDRPRASQDKIEALIVQIERSLYISGYLSENNPGLVLQNKANVNEEFFGSYGSSNPSRLYKKADKF